jgi:hypothetical protein
MLKVGTIHLITGQRVVGRIWIRCIRSGQIGVKVFIRIDPTTIIETIIVGQFLGLVRFRGNYWIFGGIVSIGNIRIRKAKSIFKTVLVLFGLIIY